jgi:glycosyltransferase involved in cell wall biosynthesis
MNDRVERVVVINDEAVNTGGAAAVALASARLLRRRGVPVTLLAGAAEAVPEIGEPGIGCVSLGGVHIMQGVRAAAALRGLFDPRTRAALAGWIASHDTPRTVYHLHNWHKVLSPSVFAALRPVEDRLFLHAHDYFLACPNGGYMHYPQNRPCGLPPMGARCLCTACDRRHYGHKLWRVARHGVRQRLFDLGDARARILAVHEGMIPYLVRGGIAETAIQVLRNPAMPWRAARVPAEENKEIFFVGRLEPDKGVDLLARAAKRLGAPLSIVGDGPLREALARGHPEARLFGWQPREVLARLIGNARLLVLPSRWPETFGLVALEALMSGVPVVISKLALIADEIVRGGLGWSCDPYDEAALAAAIERPADDDALVAAASRRAFATARRLAPTSEEWCSELLALYEEGLAAAGTSPR